MAFNLAQTLRNAMNRRVERHSFAIVGLLGSLLLGACATGQGSFVAGSGGDGGGDSAFAEEAFNDDGGAFDSAAPSLLAAGGPALLPGSRAPLATPSTGVGGATLLGVNASTGLISTPLGTASLSTQLSGPLLSLGGPRTALLGVSANPALLGSNLNLAANLGGAVTPNTAATQLLINVNAVATTPVTPPIGTPSLPPLTPPTLTSGVPGSTPLGVLVSLLPKPGGGLLGN
jgi:hypothetical protein